jgi:hypothetical protein
MKKKKNNIQNEKKKTEIGKNVIQNGSIIKKTPVTKEKSPKIPFILGVSLGAIMGNSGL